MNVKDTLKTGMNVNWKNNKFTVGDVTDDWIELNDERGIPILVKADRIRGLTKNGNVFTMKTESKIPYKNRVLELAKINEAVNPSADNIVKLLTKIVNEYGKSGINVERRDAEKYTSIINSIRAKNFDGARKTYWNLDTGARDYIGDSKLFSSSEIKTLYTWFDDYGS